MRSIEFLLFFTFFMNSFINLFFFILLFLFYIAHGLECYRCVSTNSSQPFLCNEFLTDAYDIKPESCDDVYGAKYCIKHVGRFEGKNIFNEKS
jgi:hypothetical protein